MTLADSILATDRKFTLEIRVNNVLFTPNDPTSATGIPAMSEVRITNRIGTGALCTFEVNRTPSWITLGMPVTVDIGYDGFKNRRFTGTVQDRGKGIGRGRINCVGVLNPLFRTSIIPDRDITGQTTATALGNLLTYVGIVNRSITTTATDVAEFTMGTAASTVLQNMTAAQMVAQIMELQGCEIFETGGGIAVINVMRRIPAPTAFRTYTTNANATARILASELREDPTYVRTRVKVTGATIPGTTTPSATLTSTALVTNSPLVHPPLPPGSYIDAGIFNSLADTQAKVDALALYYLTEWHRIPKYLDVDLPGDPQLECGMTLGLVIPEQDISGNFFIDGWEDVITMPAGEADEAGYRTILSGLRGGDDIGGTLTLAPRALFTMNVEREVFGTGATDFVIVSLDASPSYDPDGSLTATFTWTSNKTTIPTMASSTAKSRTVRIDSASLDGTGTDWTITLVVTDNSGATGTITQTVPYPTTAGLVTIPAIGLAYNSGFGFSPDGAQHWNDITGATCISIALRPADGVHFGYALAGFSDGSIKRTTNGGLTSATVLAAVGSAINCLAWDWRNGLVCWALTANMKLYISINEGATWGLYDDLRAVTYAVGSATPSAIAGRRAIGLPGAGGVYVFGGDGAGSPLIAYDAVLSHSWVHQTLTGDIATDTPADATLRIVDLAAPGFGTAAFIMEWASGGGGSLVAIYATTSPPGTSAAYTRATGLTAGLKNGVYIVGDAASNGDGIFRAAFGDRDVWSTVNGIAWTKTANVMPVDVTPNDAIWAAGILTGMPEFTGLYLIAAQIAAGDTVGLYKSADGLQTVTVLRPAGGSWPAWPASGKGKFVSIGAPAATGGLGDNRVAIVKGGSPNPKSIFFLKGVNWQTVNLPSQIDAQRPRPYCVTATNWFVVDVDGFPDPHVFSANSKATRTTVGGDTWVDSAIGDEAGGADPKGGMAHVVKGADGVLWGVRVAGDDTTDPIRSEIYKSIDAGATWSLSKTWSVAGAARYPWRLVPHPTNGDVIALFSAKNFDGDSRCETMLTEDGGGTWTNYGDSTSVASGNNFAPSGDFSISCNVLILTSGRFVCVNDPVGGGGSVPKMYTSDDKGTTWQLRQTADNTAVVWIVAGAAASKIVLFVPKSVDNSSYAYVSTDQGLSYAAVGPSANYSAGEVANDWSAKYDSASDALIVFNGFISSGARRVLVLSPVSASGIWTDITFDLPTGAGVWDSMALIP